MISAGNLVRNQLRASTGLLCKRCIASSSRRLFLDDQLLSKPEREEHGRSSDGTFWPPSLMAALSTATSQGEVLQLLEQNEPYGQRHMIRAVDRLAELRPQCLTDSIYTSDDNLYRLEAKLCSRVDRFGPHDVCTVLAACSHMALALANNNLLAGLCVQLRCQAQWLDTDRLADCLHALAILRARTLPLLEKHGVLPVLEASLMERIGELHGISLSKAVWAFHRLHYRSDELWTGLAQQTVALSESMQSGWLSLIGKCFAEHYGPLPPGTALKPAVEAMLHHSAGTLLRRHRTHSQFPWLSGLLWAASVLRWPAPHLALAVAHDLQRVSTCGGGQATYAAGPSTATHSSRPSASPLGVAAAAGRPAPTPRRADGAGEEDAIGLKQQSSLLSWALDKTSGTLAGILRSRMASLDRATHAGLHRLVELRTMGPAAHPKGGSRSSATTTTSAQDFQPWSALSVAMDGQSPEDCIGNLRAQRRAASEHATQGGAGRASQQQQQQQESETHSALQASSRAWSGMDVLGQSESSRLLGNLAALSSSQLKSSRRPQQAMATGAADGRAAAIARSHAVVHHLQRVLDEQRKAKAEKEIGRAISSASDHRRQMELLWPASKSPFSLRLAWFDQSVYAASAASSESLVLKSGAGIKQIPSSLLAEISQVTTLWQSNTFSDQSSLPDGVHDELHDVLRRSQPSRMESPILTPVSRCLTEFGLSCRHGVSLDCYDFDIVVDIPQSWLKEPDLTVSMSLAVVLTNLSSCPERHSPGYMVLLRRYLLSRVGADWRLLVVDVNEWDKATGEEGRVELLKKRLRTTLS